MLTKAPRQALYRIVDCLVALKPSDKDTLALDFPKGIDTDRDFAARSKFNP
jgi:hypothetical protein